MAAIFESPKVSVCMITYNHAPYIAQAIESVLMQETDFPVELVIGEDCSTDNTRAIVHEYGERYPDRIRLLLPDHNLGMIPNFVATLGACNGQYIALLEGDDYWTDPLKLQKQVDFLEAHPECSMCFHNATLLWPDGRTQNRINHCIDHLSIEDVMLSSVIPTASAVFRDGLIDHFPDWYYDLIMGDWPLWVLLAQHGHCGYIDEAMSVYRIHQGGIWSSGNYLAQLRGWFEAYEVVDRHFGFAYHRLVEQAKVNYLMSAATEYLGTESLAMSLKQRIQRLRPYVELYANDNSRLVRRFLGEYYTKYFFEAAQVLNAVGAREAILGMIWYNPLMLRNHGVWSIAAQAILGKRVATALRRGARWLVG